MFFGIWINLAADGAFRQAETTVKPFEESKTLVRNGVFHWSRNPMYLGFTVILLGISILLRALSPYIAVVVFVILIDLVFIRVEEQMLEEQFGDEWQRYRSSVRKWI